MIEPTEDNSAPIYEIDDREDMRIVEAAIKKSKSDRTHENYCTEALLFIKWLSLNDNRRRFLVEYPPPKYDKKDQERILNSIRVPIDTDTMLLYITLRNFRDCDDSKDKYKSDQNMQKARALLKHLYTRRSLEQDPVYILRVKSICAGMANDLSARRTSGDLREEIGKDSLPFPVYSKLCLDFMKDVGFYWLYMVLTWNLKYRSDTTSGNITMTLL